MADEYAWVASASCRGTELDLWFDTGRAREALEICKECPVKAECLEAARKEEAKLHFGSARIGIRGGFRGRDR